MTETLLVDERLEFMRWLADDLTLTPVETRTVRALGLRFGSWLPTSLLAQAVYRDTHHPDLQAYESASLRTHIWRIRRKLQATPWRIDNRYQHGLYRLVQRP